MKKYLFFLSVTGMMLFTACSSENEIAQERELTQEEKDAAIIAEATMNSDVQIRFGVGSPSGSVTRGPLDSDVNTKLFHTPAGSYLGIYCLAQKPQVQTVTPGPVAEEAIDWTNDDPDDVHHLLERNHPAKVVELAAGQKIGNVYLTEPASDVQLIDPTTLGNGDTEKYYYYPYGNWYNYYFYAYYPRLTGAAVNEVARKITVDYTLDGTQDIVYAKAMPDVEHPEAEVNNEGFNAKYLRSKQNPTGANSLEDLPKLELTHKLAQVRFYVQCKSPNYVAYNYSTAIGNSAPYKKLFKLKTLKLTDVPTDWQLTIADRTTPANEGKLVYNGTTTAGKATTVADISVKALADDSDPLATAVDIPFTGKELTYWTVATGEGNTYVWQETDEATYLEAVANGTEHDDYEILATNVGLSNSFLVAGNVGKIYRVFFDADNDGVADDASAPMLVGYAMIPTTAMYGDMVIDNRGENSSHPFISFTLEVGQSKDGEGNPIAATEWTSAAQHITIPAAGLEAGKVYNVILDIPVPEEVHMSATLNGWEVVPVDEDDDQNINMTVD